MTQALQLARAAFEKGEVPVGALIVDPKSGKIVASAMNATESAKDPTAHAEILAIQSACKIAGAPRIPEFDLYVTLEPCPMCAAAISFARIRRVYFGASDPKSGGIENGPRVFSHTHHKPEIYGGIEEGACGEILREFFRDKRL